MAEHDFKNFPELRNNQLQEFQFRSPHIQITEDFWAMVVKVHDGDTITLRIPERDFDFPLRLEGINAKELSEGGQEAAAWLRARLEGEEVYIELSKNRVEKWGRLLGKVIHMGMDVGQEEIWRGMAVPWQQRKEGKIINPIKRIEDDIA